MRVRTFDPFTITWEWPERGVKPANYLVTLSPTVKWDIVQVRVIRTLHRAFKKPIIILDETRTFENNDLEKHSLRRLSKTQTLNTMTVRAKFVCTIIEDHSESSSKQVSFMAVVSGSEENKSFSKYTPSGKLSMNISYGTQAADAFEVGQEYYLAIIKAS